MSSPSNKAAKTNWVGSLVRSKPKPNSVSSQNPNCGQVTWIRCQHYREVVLSVSPTAGGAQNLISGADTTPSLHRQCWESYCAPKSLTLQGYSLIKWTVATPLQLSQSPICKALPLQLRWKSCQDPFHPPPVLLEYQHPKPISSRWTIWPKPGAPET